MYRSLIHRCASRHAGATGAAAAAATMAGSSSSSAAATSTGSATASLQSVMAAAAQSTPGNASAVLTAKGRPFELVGREVKAVKKHIQSLVENKDNAVLDHIGKYALSDGGKMMRPSLIILMAYAMLPRDVSDRLLEEEIGSLDDITPGTILPFLRLAEVTEMIHTASLVHDDVIDNSDTRRGRAAVHVLYDAKRAVLGGDYLLARASKWISTLEVPHVTTLIATALEDLTRGELMQMDGCFDIESYEEKSYCKTASLIANSVASAAVLARPGEVSYENAAMEFGRRLGIAFQIVDDCLDITGDEKNLGKPKLADMREGIATLPVLLVAQRDAEIDAAVRRRFSAEGDAERCLEAILSHGTIEEALHLADAQCRAGVEALSILHSSPALDSLVAAVDLVLTRKS